MISRVASAADPFADDEVAPNDTGSETPRADAVKRPRGWRRLAQVNLLMVLIALGAVSGYFALRRNYLVPYLEQKEARELLAQKGAQFSAAPASPRWIQTLFQISDDDFQDVEMIKLEQSRAVSDADLVALHKFPGLRRLYLAATPITDEGLKHLRYCTKLRRISLWDTQVGDAGIAELETLKELRILDLHRTWTTDEALKTLGTLPTLEELVLDDSTTRRGVAHLSGLRNLRRLNLHGTGLTAECLEPLADCPIEILEMNSDFVNRRNAHYLRFAPMVRELYLALPGATDADLAWIGELRNVRSLSILWIQADGAFASEIAELPRLETLRIDSDRLRTKHALTMLAAPRLREATLSVVDFTNADWGRIEFRGELRKVAILSPWKDVELGRERSPVNGESIQPIPDGRWAGGSDAFDRGEAEAFSDASRHYVTADDLAPLLRQSGLKHLHLRDWTFAPGALAALARFESLESLELFDCEFARAELALFATLPKLKSVVVQHAPIPDAVVARFVETPNLERLDVQSTDAGPGTTLALARKGTLRTLRLASTALDEAFLEELEKTLAARLEESRSLGQRVPDLRWQIFSPGFRSQRCEEINERHRVVVRTADTFNGEYRAATLEDRPSEVWYASIDLTDPAMRALLPEDAEISFTPQGEPSPRYWPAEFYSPVTVQAIEVDPLVPWRTGNYDYVPRGSAGANGTLREEDRLDVPLTEFWNEGTLYLAVDGWKEQAAARLLTEREMTSLTLGGGALSPEVLPALEKCLATQVEFRDDFDYDAETLRAVSGMPNLAGLRFQGCRRPTIDELRVLVASPTLRSIDLSHVGEPFYFEELRELARGGSATFGGKVVYEADDAILERPWLFQIANVGEKHVARFVDSSGLTSNALRDDGNNFGHLYQRFQKLGAERMAAAQAEQAPSR